MIIRLDKKDFKKMIKQRIKQNQCVLCGKKGESRWYIGGYNKNLFPKLIQISMITVMTIEHYVMVCYKCRDEQHNGDYCETDIQLQKIEERIKNE